jgi:hypothetical protein
MTARATSTAGRTPLARPDRRLEVVAFGLILLAAAALRLFGLGARGTFDADQGHDMLVLRAFVLDGRFPLLGPPTSIGDFHHGVLYYLLLAPAAAMSGGDPIAVTTWIALGGVAAVAITGWLARAIGGSIAGLVAAGLMAVSASAVDESIFIWNPNLIALSSSIALAAAWRAWETRRPAWWVVAGAGAIVTMHCHVLGAFLTPVIAGLLIADVRRRRIAEDAAGAAAVVRALLAWVGLLLLSYVPLAIHEIGTGGEELRGALSYLGGGGSSDTNLLSRLPIVALRVLSWPLTGLVTYAPLAALASAALVVALAVWRGWLGTASGHRTGERVAIRWLALGLAWTIVALSVAASGLATVVPGLPNDHYHAFADPIVVVIAGGGLGAMIRRAGPGGASGIDRLGAAASAAIVIALVGWNLIRQPPAIAADGGWEAAVVAARRVAESSAGRPIVLSSLPTFKSDEALRMPLEAIGAEVLPAGPIGRVAGGDATRVIICDGLFRAAIGSDCEGPAEDAWLVDPASALVTGASPALMLADRFTPAPGHWISVYVAVP